MTHVTFFGHHSARSKDEAELSLAELAGQIRTTQAEAKDSLPWLKLARFGNLTTAKGSLRHDANVTEVWGVEGDYDGETISFADAVERLTKVGIEALVYTSPSHEPDRPRWRVLAPFSQRLVPSERAKMMARLNGVFDGALSDESFTLSQSYYFGHLVEAAEFAAEVVEGWSIDTMDELDVHARGKSGTTAHVKGNGHVFEGVDLTEMGRRILSGESLHPSVGRIAGAAAGKGWPKEAVIEIVGSCFAAAGAPRYTGRWDECLEFIDWVYAREEKKRAPPAHPALTWTIGSAWDGVAIAPQEWSVNNLIPANQVTLFSGHGGTGKSSMGLHLCVAHVLGKPWLNYDAKPGPAFYIDAEDALDVIHRRLDAVVAFYEDSYRNLDDLHILSLHGQGAVMARAGRGGVEATPLFHAVKAKALEVKPVQIVIASSANVFAGSEIDRVQVTEFIDLLNGLALATGGSIILIAHPSRAGMSNGDGTSGSTGWYNSVRSHMYLKNTSDTDDPTDTLRLLEIKKNQFGPPAASLSLTYRKGMFLPEGAPSVFDDARAEQAFKDGVRRLAREGRPLSDKPHARNYAPHVIAGETEGKGIKQKALERAMKRLFESGQIKVVHYGAPSRGWTCIEVQ